MEYWDKNIQNNTVNLILSNTVKPLQWKKCRKLKWASNCALSRKIVQLYLHHSAWKCLAISPKICQILFLTCLFLPVAFFRSTVWTWRVEMLVARPRCPTLGGPAARSARTSYFSTVAPTTRAAWRPWPRPTWAAATPIPTSTTTTPSASSTAASASCRSRREQTNAQNPRTRRPRLFLVCFTLCNQRDIRRDGLIVDIPLRRKEEEVGVWGFGHCTLFYIIICFLFCLLNSFNLGLEWSWSALSFFFFFGFCFLSVNQTNDLLWHSYLPYEKHFLNAWTFPFMSSPLRDASWFYNEREWETSLKFSKPRRNNIKLWGIVLQVTKQWCGKETKSSMISVAVTALVMMHVSNTAIKLLTYYSYTKAKQLRLKSPNDLDT